MKRMLILAMAVLCIALYPVSAQKSEVNENDKYYKAREIIDAKGDLNKAAVWWVPEASFWIIGNRTRIK